MDILRINTIVQARAIEATDNCLKLELPAGRQGIWRYNVGTSSRVSTVSRPTMKAQLSLLVGQTLSVNVREHRGQIYYVAVQNEQKILRQSGAVLPRMAFEGTIIQLQSGNIYLELERTTGRHFGVMSSNVFSTQSEVTSVLERSIGKKFFVRVIKEIWEEQQPYSPLWQVVPTERTSDLFHRLTLERGGKNNRQWRQAQYLARRERIAGEQFAQKPADGKSATEKSEEQ